MGKIGDLWVKLGLKKSEFDSGMRSAQDTTKTFGERLKGLAPLAKAAWAAVAAAAVKFATDAVKMTQKWGDAWNVQMQGAKAAYGAFVRNLSSGEGWTNLFDNMREAARLAREAAIALDEVFERKTSFSYQAATTEKEIAELQLIMRDTSKSDKERQAAAEKIIELEKQLGETKKDIWSQEAKAQRDIFKSQTQMNDDEIDFLVKNYNQNRDIITQSRNYLQERSRLESSLNAAYSSYGTGAMAPEGYRQIEERINAARQGLARLESETTQAVKDVAVMTQKYDMSSDDLVENMAKAEVAVINIDAEVARASARATATLGSLRNSRRSGGGGDNGLSEAQAIQKRAEDSMKDELQLLSEKYATEKAMLEQHNLDTTALTEEYINNTSEAMVKAGQKDSAILLGQYLEAEGLLQQHGIDTNALYEAYMAEDNAIVATELAKMAEDIEEFEPLEIDPIEIDTSFVDKFTEEMQRLQEEAERRGEEFRKAVAEGFSAGAQELTDQLFGLSEVNPGAIIAALLTPLADMAIREGEILIAEGIGVEACKKALESLNGWAAIAAGTALVTIGAAAKSGLSALAKSGSSSSAATTYNGNSSSGTHTEQIEHELTVYVKGEISGSDIVLAGQRTVNSWGR